MGSDAVSGFSTRDFVCQYDAYALRWREASFLLVVHRHAARWTNLHGMIEAANRVVGIALLHVDRLQRCDSLLRRVIEMPSGLDPTACRARASSLSASAPQVVGMSLRRSLFGRSEAPHPVAMATAFARVSSIGW